MVRTIPQIIQDTVPYYKKKGGPDVSHKVSYDSPSETLEPIYFFIVDLMESFGMKPEKLIDNFSSSPGSGHFGELGQRATVMQQQGAKILGDINTVLRSILNIIYDLREFKIRLQSYVDLKDKSTKDAAVLSLKQLWMDKVDMQKGNSGIKAMALGQAGFQTLIDAFLAAKTEEDVDKLDLNDRVKRILKPRIQEFGSWIKHSEGELTKRYELEKNYLRSQVNSLKLYSRWAKPYLITAQQLESEELGSRNADLVKTFNTIILQLTLFGKSKLKIKDSAMVGDLPADFVNIKPERGHFSCVLVEFKFRGIPSRLPQGQGSYVFGGKADITFSSYGLNQDEIDKIDEELKNSDVEDALNLVEGTTESFERMREEIDFFLDEPEIKTEKEVKDTSNPILALIGFYEKKEKKPEKKEPKKNLPLRADSWIEKKHIRPLVIQKAKDQAFKLFEVYKKSHGMASFH